MRDHMRFAAAYWHVMRNGLSDPFGGPTRDAIPILDRLPLLAEAGMSFYEAHDTEIPASDAARAVEIARQCGLQCA